jgi:AbrB family looped-hinge helix DNA binding protein
MAQRKGASIARETPPPYAVDVADRGRVVLPAGLRRDLGIHTGDRFTVTVDDDGSLRLTRRIDIVKRLRGVYRQLAPGRSLADELIAERRREAKRDDRK